MHITPDEAAKALGEVRRVQRTALRAAPPMFPAWYAVAVWGFVLGAQAATEVLTGPATWVAMAVLAIGLAAAVIVFLWQMYRAWPLRPHRSVVDPWAWAGFAAWVAGTTIVQFLATLALRTAEFAHPRTGGTLVTFVLVLLTARAVPRWMATRNVRRAETR
jgi:hypothetical protein